MKGSLCPHVAHQKTRLLCVLSKEPQSSHLKVASWLNELSVGGNDKPLGGSAERWRNLGGNRWLESAVEEWVGGPGPEWNGQNRATYRSSPPEQQNLTYYFRSKLGRNPDALQQMLKIRIKLKVCILPEYL